MYLAEMAAHRQEPPDEGSEEDQGKKTVAATYTTEARRLVAARVIANYNYLRENCPLLPQTGYLARTSILQGAADQIRLLKHENQLLQWRISANWEAQRISGTRLLGQVPAENPGPQDAQERKGVRARPKPKTLLRSEDQPPLLQDEIVQDINVGGEGALQIVEVRGGCQWPFTEPLPNHQAQSRKQFKSPTLGQIARGRGGEKVDDLAKRKVAGAHAWGGETRDRRGNECPEVRVVWGGTVERPAPIVSHPARPRLAGSPPLEERSWVATPIGRKIQWGSSTLQRIRTTPTKKTLIAPTTLNIPTNSLGVPRGNDVVPMDLTNKSQPLQEMLRECLMAASPPRLIPSERWPAFSPPPLSRDSFGKLPTHGIAQILKSPDVLEEAMSAIHDTTIGGVEDEVLINVPVTREDNKEIGLETTTTTRSGLWSPAEDIMWPASPPSTRDSKATPMRDPEPVTSPTLTSSSTMGTPPTRAIIRIAKWVGELGDSSDNNQEMDVSVSEEDRGDKNSPVKGDVDSTEGIKSTLNTDRHEVENVNIQPKHKEIGDDEMLVDVDEPVTTSEETPETTIYVDREIEETRLTWMPESSTREDAEEELDVGGPVTTSEEASGLTIDVDQQIEETKPTWIPESSTGEYVEQLDEKEMLKELFKDQQDETEDLKDLKTLKTQPATKPATIPQWPRHIASYHGEVEGSEVFIDWPNSPTYQPPPVRSILESTWIEVIPNEDTTGISHLTAREENKPEIKVTSDDDAGTTPRIETPPSQDVVKYEVISDDETAEAIDRNSEGEGEGKVGEIGEKDEEGKIKTAKVRGAYVAIRKLRLQGWKIREKAFKQKQKRKKKKTKWMFEKDREDKDWKPPRSRRKKMKAPPRIKLVRRRPISDDEEETEPSYRQPLQRRAWAGATLRHQSEVITFYKTLHKLRIKEGKRRQRKRRREEEQGARGEVVTTAAPASEVVRETPSPGRQHCLRKSGSEDWAAEGRGGRSNGREQREGLEVNPEATQSEVQKICHMERPEQVQGNVVVDTGEAVGQDLEKESGTKQSPSREKKDGYRGETVAKEEDVQGGGAGGADHREDVQEKENIQEEAAEQQKRARLLRKLRRSNSIDLRLLLPPLGLDRTSRPAPSHPLPRSSGCRVSCGDGPQEEWVDLPAKFESDRLKSNLVTLIKK